MKYIDIGKMTTCDVPSTWPRKSELSTTDQPQLDARLILGAFEMHSVYRKDSGLGAAVKNTADVFDSAKTSAGKITEASCAGITWSRIHDKGRIRHWK